MINADALPSLFTSATYDPSGRIIVNGVSLLLASIDGAWTTTRDPDGVHVSAELFQIIAGGAAEGDGSLLLEVDGEIAAWAIGATVSGGARWLALMLPGEA